MNKKIFIGIIVIIIVIVVGILLFKNNKTKENENTETNNPSNEIKDNNEDKNNTESVNGKILVVYYSATGSTKRVAEEISKNLNADLFEIEPVDTYTSNDLDWTNNNSRVSKEHNDESVRNVELKNTKVDNFDSYNTILIGYPIWWGIAAWPVDNFVRNNDFTGKTVIPFCTSASSGLGQSGKLLENITNSGTWKEGHRFSSSASISDIKSWTDTLK